MSYFKAKQTRYHKAHPNAGAHYSPRSLYRGLKVAYSNKPGKKRIHKKEGPKA